MNQDPDRLHEECGVVGVYGVPDAAQVAYLSLYAIQHRGQESSGLVACDEGRFSHHKAMGLVSDVFSGDVLERLPGNMAIGHNRYSTKGSSSLRNAQPIWVNYHGGDLALAHNGQLVNAAGLRRDMETAGSIFQTTSDSEVMVHLIAASRAPSFEARFMSALHQVDGAFSITALTSHGVYVARDGHGFRPLVIGRLDEGWVVASETCALDIVDARFVREVNPGEVIAIDGGGLRTVGSLPDTTLHQCVFELIYFSRPDSVVFGESVDRVRRRLGRQLAEEHPVEADCVISVPDSSNSAALGFAEISGIPYELGLIRNHYIGRTFIRPGQSFREAGVRVKYNVVKSLIDGRRVVVVDDSVVRGTTSKKLVGLLRRAGAREVHFRVASPPIMGTCHYGIDTPSPEELIAATHAPDEIARELGVDSLGYLSLDGLQAAVSAPGEHCYACFTGAYPVPLSEEEVRRREGRSPGILDPTRLTDTKETAQP